MTVVVDGWVVVETTSAMGMNWAATVPFAAQAVSARKVPTPAAPPSAHHPVVAAFQNTRWGFTSVPAPEFGARPTFNDSNGPFMPNGCAPHGLVLSAMPSTISSGTTKPPRSNEITNPNPLKQSPAPFRHAVVVAQVESADGR